MKIEYMSQRSELPVKNHLLVQKLANFRFEKFEN